MATTKLLTAEDLFEMGPDSDYELIRGELVPMPPTGHHSSNLALRIAIKVGAYIEAHGLGSMSGADGGYILGRNPDIVVAPDMAFVSKDRLPDIEAQMKFLELAPDLVAEVVSPSDRFTDVNDKVMIYLNAGVRLIWVVDPERETVTVYAADHPLRVLTTADTLNGGDVLPGFELAVSELFS